MIPDKQLLYHLILATTANIRFSVKDGRGHIMFPGCFDTIVVTETSLVDVKVSGHKEGVSITARRVNVNKEDDAA
jgi:hypothetical protein